VRRPEASDHFPRQILVSVWEGLLHLIEVPQADELCGDVRMYVALGPQRVLLQPREDRIPTGFFVRVSFVQVGAKIRDGHSIRFISSDGGFILWIVEGAWVSVSGVSVLVEGSFTAEGRVW
jgi:hypothetical protein